MSVDKPKDTVPDGHYPLNAPDHLVSSNGAWWLGLHTDGTVELRHNGDHVRWIVSPGDLG